MNFSRYIEIANGLYDEHEHSIFHATFIIVKNKIVSIGVNKPKSNPKTLKYNYRAKDGTDISRLVGTHSELVSIIKYGRADCRHCTFVNIRLDGNRELNNSRYCSGCLDILTQVGFKRAYYSTSNGFLPLVIPN
jgi:deoxycytidylate deaminase